MASGSQAELTGSTTTPNDRPPDIPNAIIIRPMQAMNYITLNTRSGSKLWADLNSDTGKGITIPLVHPATSLFIASSYQLILYTRLISP